MVKKNETCEKAIDHTTILRKNLEYKKNKNFLFSIFIEKIFENLKVRISESRFVKMTLFNNKIFLIKMTF